MKKKLVAFAVTAAMVITSAVPVFAATPTTGWDAGTVVEGNKIVVSAEKLNGYMNKSMAGDELTKDGQTVEAIVDLGGEYKEGDVFRLSLGFNDENGDWVNEFIITTTKNDNELNGTFKLTSNVDGANAIENVPAGIYYYTWNVGLAGDTPYATFTLYSDANKDNKVGSIQFTKDDVQKKDLSEAKTLRYLWAFGNGDTTAAGTDEYYQLDRDLVMYVEYPEPIAEVQVVDAEGEAATEVFVGDKLTANVVLKDGTVITPEDKDMHIKYTWTATDKNGKETEIITGNYANAATIDASAYEGQTISVKVEGIRGYYGKATWKSGTVTDPTDRLAGDNRYETAIEVADAMMAKQNVKEFKTIVVASGMTYCDALSGTALAAQEDAPILLVNGNTEDAIYDYIVKNLATNGHVYILGGETAVSAEFEDMLYKYDVDRLGGADRYETNLAILAEIDSMAGKDLMVASGTSYADALSAASTGNPILLVADTLSAEQKAYISKLNSNMNNIYVVGGKTAVSAKAMTQVKNNAADVKTGILVERLGGANRYATNNKVVRKFCEYNGLDKVKNILIASGNDFADALTGGAYAAVIANGDMGACPVLLVNDYNTNLAKKFIKEVKAENSTYELTVIGGPNAVSDEIIAKIA